MANSPVNYSPVLRRLRANSGYKGPAAAKEEILTSPLSSGGRSYSVSEEDSRWRPRSFDSFFQDSSLAQSGALLADFDHLRPFNNSDNSASSSSPSSTARHTTLSESAPSHRTRSPHGEGVSALSPSSSASSSPSSSSSTVSPSSKLAPRQLFDQQQQQQQLQQQQQQHEATSPNTSDSDSNEANLFNSYNAYTNAYTSPLSFSTSAVPVRSRADASLGSRLAGSMAGAVAHAMAAANRPSPPRSASVDLGHVIPLAKSFSDGEIEVKFTQERASSQSPLRLLAARNNLETPTSSPPRESALMAALTSSDDVDQLADYDSEMGSSDYEDSEEEGVQGGVGPGLGGEAGRRASVSAASGANFMRKRVLWQRSRSLSGKSSGYQAFRSSIKSSAGSSARSGSASSSGLRWVGLWLYLLLAVEVATLFYVGYTFRLSYSAVSLNEFGGFMERYPNAEEAHVGWKQNALDTCQSYLAWLQVRLEETKTQAQPAYVPPPVYQRRQPWYRLKKTHRHITYRSTR